jgi:prepilin-type N-terminal cleavage/methylation domain-containing protein
MKHKHGFTLIELVIVIVVLSILAAVALPRFMNFTDDARSALVEATGGAFSTGLNLARAKWELRDGIGDLVDLNDDGIRDTQFGKNGWPIGVSADGKTIVSSMNDGGVSGHDACSEIMGKVINTTGLSIIPANERGVCSSGDFCAKAISPQECVYIYRATEEKIRYRADSGEVFIE